MNDKTYIKGKDAALEESIATMQKKLAALNFDIEEASKIKKCDLR
jgi:ribosomal protein S12 methylthiotransferase accessory factor